MHITYANDPIYFKSSLHSSQYLIKCKCYVNSCCIELFRGWWQGKFMYIFNAWFFSYFKNRFIYLFVCVSKCEYMCMWRGGMCVHMEARWLHHSLPVLSLNLGLRFSLSAPPRAGLQAFSEIPCLLSGCWASLLSHFSSPILITNSFFLCFFETVLVLSLGWFCTHYVDSSDGKHAATFLP